MQHFAALRTQLQHVRAMDGSLVHKISALKASSHPLLPLYLGLLCFSLLVINTRKQLYLLARFAYSCFLAPIGHTAEQKNRLDKFYKSQASIYDATRSRLLKGREEMLRLTASHLQDQIKKRQTAGETPKKLVWVDIGGGTGWNIEKMDEYFPISEFHAIFLIDLCEPLLEVARKRFADKGWKNVHVLCQDASAFVLPQLGDGSMIHDISLCTMSYSLSMIPNFYGMLDRIERFLDPIDGLVGCVDFYVSGRDSQDVMKAGDTRRHCSWWTRWFWLHWFEWDHVDLHPSRRNYLEWRFGTIKSINARNAFGHVAAIPYYIWLGCKAHRDLPERLSAFGADPLTPAFSPTLSVTTPNLELIPELTLSPALAPTLPRSSSITTMNLPSSRRAGKTNSVIDMVPPPSPLLEPTMAGTPLSAFYYQKHNYRMPYHHGNDQKLFRSWIYGFTWEDPVDDMHRMKIAKTDTVLCITSAGDNALHYAIKGQPKRIHCVDMNPCQGHLLELKLAAINALEYEEFWQLFGEGKHPDFEKVLDSKLAAHLSAHAYNFWKVNSNAFESAFYLKGYSGWALRILNTIFAMRGQTADLTAFAEAETLAEQRRIYDKKIRPVLLSGSFVKLILSNPVFLWNSLGVPMNQLAMLQNESSVRQYCIDTLDPLGRTVHIRRENYHYYLCLTSRYHPENPPAYLTREGFATLKASQCASLEAFRLHTDSLDNVIRTIEAGSLDVWIGMDHQDWFSPTTDVDALKSSIRAIRKAMPVGGRAFWRSAAMKPWYAEIWATEGFRVERLSNRTIGTEKPIDSVNMYASLWRAIRV